MSTLKYEGRWFVQGIYRDILHDPRLSPAEKGMFVALMGFVSNTCRQPFPSLDYLARIMGVTRQSVQKYIKGLEAAGLLTKQQRRDASDQHKWMSNSYTIYDTFPEKRPIHSEDAIRNAVVNKTDYGKTDYGNTVYREPTYKGEAILKERSASGLPSPPEERNTTTTTREDETQPSASFAPTGGAGGGVLSSEEKTSSLSPEVVEAKSQARHFLKSWVPLVRKMKGFKMHPQPDCLDRIETFFLDNPEWFYFDILWVAFQAILKAERNPRPPHGTRDPYCYCRGADNTRWFGLDKDGNSKVVLAAGELGYHQELNGDQIFERIDAYLRSLKS